MSYPAAQRKRPKLVRNLFILVLITALAYGIHHYFFAAKPEVKTPPVPAVTVKEVHNENIPLVFEYPARLAGSREVEIRARVGGILLKRYYTEGQYVHAGDLLVQIDPEPYKATLAQAEATFAQASSDYQRAAKLMKQKALSAREYDQAQALYGSAKAQVDSARINLAFTAVRSPISGYTSEEANSEGTLVVADTTLLTRVTQLDPMYVEFAYSDSEAMMQRQGIANGSIALPKDKLLHVEIISASGVSYDREGIIHFTDAIINPDTGTVRARAVVQNKDQSIMPGQFVRVKVKGMTYMNAIGIPERALMQGPMGTFVYTVNPEGKAVISVVELGLLNNGTQIIRSGLNEGDKVVVEGMIKVKPDMPVCIDTEEKPCHPKTDAKAGEAKKPAEQTPAKDKLATEEKPAQASASDKPADTAAPAKAKE